MAEFKAGDKVIRVGGSMADVKQGQEYEVEFQRGFDFKLKGIIGCYLPENFKLVSSALPTDRPLTYDEVLTLKEGDVVDALGEEVVKEVTDTHIIFQRKGMYYDGNAKWSIGRHRTDGVKLIRRASETPKEEVKGVAKEPVWTSSGVVFDDMLKYPPLGKIFLSSSPTPSDVPVKSKSVSQILYGR